MKNITKDYFISLVGDTYKAHDRNPAPISGADIDELCEYFHDDDLLLEEWLHCRRHREPLIIHEENELGDELIFTIRSDAELYDYFCQMKYDAEHGIAKFRY